MAWESQAEVLEGFADEAGLVAGLRAGDGEAFKALHAAYAAPIYNLALRIVDDPQEAQDVAQEVLLKVFRGLPGSEGGLNLPAWLYRVTVNAAFDQVRARKRRPVTVAEEAAHEVPAAPDEFERAELSRRVESTLHELPKRQQLALVLRDVHGLSVGETATVLGITKGSTDVLLSRARAGFRRLFLSGAGALTGRCDQADKALAGGVGRGEPVPGALLEHARTCPDCRRAVEFWGATPVGLGLLLPQVALPAQLSLGATLAAAQAAGIAVPAGLEAGAAAGAAASSAATAAGSGAAAGVSAGAATAGVGGGAGLLAALGSAAAVKIATVAAVATTAVGVTGVAMVRSGAADAPARASATPASSAVQPGPGGGGPGTAGREHGRLIRQGHSDDPGAGDLREGRAGGKRDGEAAGGSAGRQARDGSGSGGSSGAAGGSESSGGSRSGSRMSSGSANGSVAAPGGSGGGAGSGSAQAEVQGQGTGSGGMASGGGETGGSGGGLVSGE
jgi:RNA polymerase sigma factor (sigma-70 family)